MRLTDHPTDPLDTADRIRDLVKIDTAPLDLLIVGAAAIALNDRYVTDAELDAFAAFSDKIDPAKQPTERNIHEVFQKALLTIRAHQSKG